MKVIRVVENFHDYEAKSYYIDPTLLDNDVIAEKAIKEALTKNPSDFDIRVTLRVDEFPEINCNSEELMMSGSATVEDSKVESNMIANQLIWLRMICE